MDAIQPSWVQAGELGLAFVVLILATWLVLFVLKTSGRREAALLKIVQDMAPVLNVLLEKVDDMNDRLQDVEVAVGVQRKTMKKTKATSTTRPRGFELTGGD